MKRTIFLITSFLLCSILSAQTGPIDELFERYSEKEGFTSVFISGKMLNMLGGMGAEESNSDNIMLRLKSIRILTENDSVSGLKINFYTELSRKLDFSVYEELLVVQEGKDLTKFLIRQTGDKISELLVISGGSQGNSLISIRGDINLKDISKISKTIGIEELEQLEGIDKKQPVK